MVRPPAAKPSKMRPLVISVAVVAVVALLAAGAFIVVARSSAYPPAWDPRISDLVSFVSKTRKLDFTHPVYVDFMSEDDFKAHVSAPEAEADQTDEQKQQLQQAVELFRAFGLLQGEVNLLEQSNTLRQGGTLASYDPRTKRISVRGTEVDLAHKVTIVHELTHVLQDQSFDLTRLTKLSSDDERTAFRTVIEGDAVRIENKFVAQLPDSEQKTYKAQEKKDADQAKGQVSTVPDVLLASFSAPYAFGAPFLDLLEAKGGNAEVDRALRHPPPSEGQILDPNDYFNGRAVTDVHEPAVPKGMEKVQLQSSSGEPSSETERIGVLDFFMMLSARVDPHQALKAADNYNGDAMVAYRNQGKLCAKVVVAGDGPAAAAALSPILQEWKGEMPSAATTAVEQSDDRFEITTCDPGPQADAHIVGKPSEVFALPTVRLYVYAGAFQDSRSESRSDCIAKAFTDNISVAEATSEASDVAALRKRFADAKAACP